MEKELRIRLSKVVNETPATGKLVDNLLNLTIATLEAIRAHVIELHPDRFGDSSMLEDAIEVVTDYR